MIGLRSTKPSARMLRLTAMPDRIYAIGDIHGCYAQLITLEDMIRAHAHWAGGSSLVIVLGDMIDRGPDSAKVLDHLTQPMPGGMSRICLLGNHEQMMLKFWDKPKAHKSWLRHGGQQTLASYGVYLDDMAKAGADVRHQMHAAIPPEHVEFLQGCPMVVDSPAAVFCHASIDPHQPLTEQSTQDLLWGDPNKIAARDLDRLLVHGHIPVGTGAQIGRRINVDSHCYASGRLTAVCIHKTGAVEFLAANAAGPITAEPSHEPEYNTQQNKAQ